MTTELLWQSLHAPGFEHVRLDTSHAEWNVFDSMFVREADGEVRRGGYTLIVDKAWRTLELRIMVEQEPGKMDAQHLLATGEGAWSDADGNRIPELDGCIDVDIQWSPLTNTLPIRRLNLPEGEDSDISVAYVTLPGLSLSAMTQRYTRVNSNMVRYASVGSDFRADLSIDEDGYVTEYPDIFSRTWPA